MIRVALRALPAIVAWWAFAAVPAAGQATLQTAQSALRAGDFQTAATALQGVTAAEPDNGLAWALLGYALRNLGDFDAAVAAYDHAVPLRPAAGGTFFQGGMAQAQAGHLDRAFRWLDSARALGVDVTGVDLDPAGEILAGDPRYASLFPSEADFADPFAEPVKIIREWRGEHRGDQFGWIARDMGDVDDDGADDVVTSAPSWGPDGSAAGRVYAYSSRSGALLWTAEGPPGGQLGQGVEAAGDVNADGIPDVIAAAPHASRAYVYSGLDGTVLFTLKAPGDGPLGPKVSDLGDVNGDGHDDVLVGAPQDDHAGPDAGRAYVFSGLDGSVLLTLSGEKAGDNFGSAAGGVTRDGELLLVVGAPNAGAGARGRAYVYKGLTDRPAFVIDSDPEGSQLGGMFVSVVGDVDGDGAPDVYASDWPGNGDGGLQGAGRVYVHSGADGRRLYTLTGEEQGDGFGIGVADAGDVDRDGHADLVIGAWQHASQAPSGGKVYVFSGKDGSLLRAITGKVMAEAFGFDATGIGDVDGDGVPDLLVTSAWSAVAGAHSGRVFILSGTTGAPPR